MRLSAFKLAESSPGKQYLYVPGELLVHNQDSHAAEVALDPLGYTRGNRSCGRVDIFTASPQSREVPDVVDEVRRGQHRALRISPHYGFGACQGRIPRTADHARATSEVLDRLEGDTGSITVGVVDTGIVLHDDEQRATPHTWLASRIARPWDQEDRLPDQHELLEPGDAHGTFVAGLILKQAPAVSIRMESALEGGFASDEVVANAIETLGREGVKLINLSFSGATARVDTASGDTAASPWDSPGLLSAAISGLPADVVVVAAAGNFADDHPVWPAAHERVIAVGAVDEWSSGHRQPAGFSSYGPWVDAYADGVSVLGPFCFYEESEEPGSSCDLHDCWHTTDARRPQHYRGWARWSGTSFAAATVTGAIARLAADEQIKVCEAAKRLLDRAATMTVSGLTRPYIASASG